MTHISTWLLHNHNAEFFENSLTKNGKNICLSLFGKDLVAFMFDRLKGSTMKAIEEAVASKSPDNLFELERDKRWFGKIFQPMVKRHIETVVANGYPMFGDRWKTLDPQALPSGNDIEDYIDFWMITFTRFVFMDFQQDLERLLGMHRNEMRWLKSWNADRHHRFNRKKCVLGEMAEIMKGWV
ncbi:MAG: hypothetical protein [Bacteriophage sp.]|nr:MAG: hypothetical protein [Bacteriophage sp.]